MVEKATHTMNFVRPRDPIPTVEVDLDGIPEELHGYGDIVGQALQRAAQRDPALRATIYVYQGASVNFLTNTWSGFFGVAGSKTLLHVLRAAFEEAGVRHVRFSDYISAESGICEFHVEDGLAWQPVDAASWQSVAAAEAEAVDGPDDDEDTVSEEGQDDELEDEDAAGDEGDEDEDGDAEDEADEDEDEAEGPAGRALKPLRYKAARSDASVGTIRRKIEQVFGLPEGSVALCGPNGKALRADALIATLRRRWDEA